MDAETLAAYVLADPSDRGFVAQCLETATSLVDAKIGRAQVPAQVRRAAILEVGANLFHRRQSSRDSATGIDADTGPSWFRPALDPLTPAWPLLRPFLEGPAIV